MAFQAKALPRGYRLGLHAGLHRTSSSNCCTFQLLVSSITPFSCGHYDPSTICYASGHFSLFGIISPKTRDACGWSRAHRIRFSSNISASFVELHTFFNVYKRQIRTVCVCSCSWDEMVYRVNYMHRRMENMGGTATTPVLREICFQIFRGRGDQNPNFLYTIKTQLLPVIKLSYRSLHEAAYIVSYSRGTPGGCTKGQQAWPWNLPITRRLTRHNSATRSLTFDFFFTSNYLKLCACCTPIPMG